MGGVTCGPRKLFPSWAVNMKLGHIGLPFQLYSTISITTTGAPQICLGLHGAVHAPGTRWTLLVRACNQNTPNNTGWEEESAVVFTLQIGDWDKASNIAP